MTTKQPVSVDTHQPRFAVSQDNLNPVHNYPSQMQPIPPSRMFLIGDALKAYREKFGADAVTYDASQGDGGKSLPGVPREILEEAVKLQIDQGTGYDKPWGTPLFRQVTAEHYWKLEAASGWGPENITFVQGGRDGLMKIYDAIVSLGNGRIGDALVVSRVPWISYNWGPYAAGLNVLLAPGDPADGWRITPEAVKASAEYARAEGRDVAALVITSPDNPTGRTLTVDAQIELARTALENGYPFVIFDWIYHWLSDSGPTDINTVLQAFSPEERDRLIFLDGLTKSLGASNIRSAHVLSNTAIGKFITSRASHGVIPSFYAQAVAIAAYRMGYEKASAGIVKPTSESRQVLRAALEGSDLPFIMGDGYYAFIDCSDYLEAGGLKDTEALLMHLGESHGLAVVPGIYFSDAGTNWIRFSYALAPEYTQGAVDRLFEGLAALKS